MKEVAPFVVIGSATDFFLPTLADAAIELFKSKILESYTLADFPAQDTARLRLTPYPVKSISDNTSDAEEDEFCKLFDDCVYISRRFRYGSLRYFWDFDLPDPIPECERGVNKYIEENLPLYFHLATSTKRNHRSIYYPSPWLAPSSFVNDEISQGWLAYADWLLQRALIGLDVTDHSHAIFPNHDVGRFPSMKSLTPARSRKPTTLPQRK